MWYEGSFNIGDDKFRYCAKVYESGSKYGIDNSRISKLQIVKDTGARRLINDPVVQYDRGWVVKPRSTIGKEALEYVLELFR